MDQLLHSTLGEIILLIVVLVAAHWIVKQFLAGLVRRAVPASRFASRAAEKKREDTLIGVISTVLSILLWIIGVIWLLGILDVNIVGLITGAGVIGVAIGLGGQNALQDYLAGFFILIENQYRVGDIITLDSVSGQVESISLRTTSLRDLDGHLHFIPNGSIKVVTNRTFDWANVNMNVGVSYDADIDKVKEVINETGKDMAADSGWKEHIIEPIAFLRVDEFGDSSVNIKALGRVKPGEQWDVAGEFRARLKKAFDKHGIEIPFPQRVIHTAGKKAT